MSSGAGFNAGTDFPCLGRNELDPRTPSHARAAALMACAALLWSIAGVVTRHLEAARAFEITFWRSVFAGLFVLAGLGITLRGGGWRSTGRATWRAVSAIGCPGLVASVCFAIMYVCFMVALTTTTVANTLVVLSLAPVFTASQVAALRRQS